MLSITRRDGGSVRVAESAMVAGKVVPPRAPARRRGLVSASVRELTAVAARGWPAVETEALGSWTLRASAETAEPVAPAERAPRADGERGGVGGAGGGERAAFTTRANSLLPLGDPGLPVREAIARTVRWYEARGLAPLVQLVPGGEGESREDGERALLADELERSGWTAERHAVMQVAPLAPLADRAPDPRVRLSRDLDAGWSALYRRAGQLPDVARKVLTGGPSVWFATVPREAVAAPGQPPEGDTRPAAIGRCVVDGRWAGFAALEVAPEWRRRGLATAVLSELARRALEEGASAAYLQVEAGNAGARALYGGLGFTDHHTYHYRRAPQGGSV